MLLVSDVCGEKRFVSTVARRLQSLGALSGDGGGSSRVAEGRWSDVLESLETAQGSVALLQLYSSLGFAVFAAETEGAEHRRACSALRRYLKRRTLPALLRARDGSREGPIANFQGPRATIGGAVGRKGGGRSSVSPTSTVSSAVSPVQVIDVSDELASEPARRGRDADCCGGDGDGDSNGDGDAADAGGSGDDEPDAESDCSGDDGMSEDEDDEARVDEEDGDDGGDGGCRTNGSSGSYSDARTTGDSSSGRRERSALRRTLSDAARELLPDFTSEARSPVGGTAPVLPRNKAASVTLFLNRLLGLRLSAQVPRPARVAHSPRGERWGGRERWAFPCRTR